jgi:1-acyl-sn-glycerol-3-phosphate acyltransferase
MNRQPYQTPPRYWPPLLSKWWVELCRPLRLRELHRKQKILRIDIDGLGPLRKLLDENAGVLITPNHSFHYDSYILFEAAHRVCRPFHIMTAWQVFAMSSWLERWWMQRHGCFSIDRESNDLQALRQSVNILVDSPYPLVVFPEGDIYHTNDQVTPFREGAAAIALAAARRAKRKIYCVPCALKCWYVKDPTPALLRLMDRLEQRLLWRPRPDLSLPRRVLRLADGALSLKEVEHLGHPRTGGLPQRASYLADTILRRQERFYELEQISEQVPERVKELRRSIIQRMEQPRTDVNDLARFQSDMEDLFFVIQLYSYPGDYLVRDQSIERIAETLDKFEEDLLRANLPGVRGTRRVAVRFGEPIPVAPERQRRDAVPLFSRALETKVQQLLDALNADQRMRGTRQTGSGGGNSPR